MKSKFLLSLISCLIFVFVNGFAQNDPCFEATVTKGCAPFTVNLKDCSGADASLIFYTYSDGAAPVKATSFTYSNPGKYTITQIVNTGGSAGKKLEKKDYIEVLAPKQVNFELKACVGGFFIEIKDNNYDKYLVDIGSGTPFEMLPNTSINKTAPNGKITVKVKGLFVGATDNCGETVKSVDVISEMKVAEWKYVKVINASTVELGFKQPSVGVEYGLESSFAAIFSPLASLPSGSESFTQSGLTVDDLPMNYRISATDFCTNAIVSTNSFNTTFLRNFNDEDAIMLSWNTALSSEFVKYNVYREDVLIAEIKEIGTNFFKDKDIICGNTYCYRVEAVFEGENVFSISNTTCLKAVSNKKPVALSPFYITIYNQLAELRWRIPKEANDVRIINFIRTEGGANLDTVLAVPVNDSTYLDLASAPNDSICCYRLSYTDACGNVSDFSYEACPVFLILTREKDYMRLEWSGYVPNMGTYYLQILNDKDELVSLRYVNRYSLSYPLSDFAAQTTRFRIMFTNGNFISHSNIRDLVLLPEIEYPTAFTPNGDGLNDEFGAFKARFVQNFTLNIYNQWGNVVFTSNEPGGRWDGKYMGVDAPADVYTYSATYQDLRQISLVTKGIVHLLR